MGAVMPLEEWPVFAILLNRFRFKVEMSRWRQNCCWNNFFRLKSFLKILSSFLINKAGKRRQILTQ